MLKTLYAKLAAVLLGLFCLIGVFYVLLTLFTTQMHLQEVNQKLNRTLAEHLVSKNILMTEGRINEAVLKDIFHMLMVINPNIEIYLLDPNGAILAFSALPGKVKRQEVSLEPIRRFLNKNTTLPILGDDPRDVSRKKIFSVCPIPVAGPVEGYLYVILSGEEYDSVAQMLQGSYILRLSTGVVSGGLLFALLAGLVFFNLLTRRLRRLASTMEAFKQSNFSEPIKQSVHDKGRFGDEIDRLGETFNQMTDRIVLQMTKLKEADALRRELVANVSHDLRTPLASLHGYLETLLLKEGTLTPEEHRNYLEIATKHSERLGKLVSELFELAKLDSYETQPHVEPFSLSELVQDVVQKFQLTSEKKRVGLRAELPKNLPFVSADIGLIERVLENLIENALRYTPEGGAITIALVLNNDRVKIQVADTGCGIPQEELPYIFDRFYRVEKHERSDGAGLGLAIAKRILELHGSSIEASSVVNNGTTFTFHLPVYKP
ncbi:MAG: HAMP domain-containing protein [Nitrospirae bacterium]|nr:HAMP domain-containing protein [Nitrospirota bacterium]